MSVVSSRRSLAAPQLRQRTGRAEARGRDGSDARRGRCRPPQASTDDLTHAGDRSTALSDITALLRDQTRWADLVGCNHDGEFILILQETTQDSALLLVDKLTAHLKRISEDRDTPIGACYGVTECQKNDDAAEILERAEGALAEARNNQSGTAIAV